MTVLGEQLISIVRVEAAETPDYIYRPPNLNGACLYVHQGRPSCLIGHALWGAGLIDANLPSARSGSSVYINEESIRTVAVDLELDLSIAEINWLAHVQGKQDRASSWGDAVASADAKFPVPA